MSRRLARQSASVRHVRRLIWVVVTAVAASFAFVGSASAVEAKPGWEVGSRVYPTNLKPGGKGMVVVEVDNTGAGSTNGTVTVTDALPPGLEAVEANALTPLGEMGNEKIEVYEEQGEFNEMLLEEGGGVLGVGRRSLAGMELFRDNRCDLYHEAWLRRHPETYQARIHGAYWHRCQGGWRAWCGH